MTRFVPTTLRVKRTEDGKTASTKGNITADNILKPDIKPGQTKDDAYMQFMKEMEGLL